MQTEQPSPETADTSIPERESERAPAALERAAGAPKRNRVSATALGCLSLVLGATAILAPRKTARLLGTRPTAAVCRTLRAVGAREIVAGVGLLGSRDSPRPWTLLRVAGDAMDLAMLVRATRLRLARQHRLAASMAVVAGITVLDALAAAAQSE